MTDSEALIRAALEAAEEVRKDPNRFGEYEDRPIDFCEDVLGVNLWHKQEEILEATLEARRVAVRSGHSTGKTFAVACLVLWWLYARKGLVVTTAPTKEHVEDVLWRQVAEIVVDTPVHLPGEQLNTEHRISSTWYAVGLTTNMPGAFQGRHHPRLLVIIDEAAGVAEQIHIEISTLATGLENCVVMIGNPTSTSGTFYEAFARPGMWKLLHLSCLDHPNVKAKKEIIKGAVTYEWVEDARQRWGEDHPFWYSRVLGVFPKISERGVIPLGWVEEQTNEEGRMNALHMAEIDGLPLIGGLDVARYGSNASVLTIRRGDAIKKIVEWHHRSLMETAGIAKRMMEEEGLGLLIVDASGIGAGVYDRLLEQGLNVYAYNGGHRAFTPSSFGNRRSEMWWHLRERFEKKKIWLPPDQDKLVGDLIAPEYEISSAGRLKVQTKEALLKEGKPSPDYADSLVLCFAADEDPFVEIEAAPEPGQDPEAWRQEESGDDPQHFPSLPHGF